MFNRVWAEHDASEIALPDGDVSHAFGTPNRSSALQ